MPLRGTVLIAFFVLSLPVCFVRPFYGILLWTIVAFLNPQSYVWSAGSAFPWATSVAIATILGLAVFRRGSIKRLFSRESYLLVALWIWFTITSIVSVNTPLFVHHADDTWQRWSFVSKVLLMTFVTMAAVTTLSQLRTLVLVISSCFGVFVAKALPFVIITGGSYRLYGPARSMVADNNDFGLALNMTIPLFFFLAQTESKRWTRRLFLGLFLITIPAVFFTYSRGALIGLIAVLLAMFVQGKQRLILIPVVALGLLVAILFAPTAWKERMDPTHEGALDASAESRLNAWTYSWRLVSDFPVFGGGFDTFTPELFDKYAPNPLDIHGPHSVYFGILAEHGFFGLFLYLSLVFSCFATAHKLIKESRYYGDHTAAKYANMFRFSLVGFLTSGMFLGRAYFDYFFTIVACLVILKRCCHAHWAEQDSREYLVTENEDPGLPERLRVS